MRRFTRLRTFNSPTTCINSASRAVRNLNSLRKGWIITSTRKIDQTPLWVMLYKLIGFGFGLQKRIRSKEYCEHWYEKAAR